MIFSIKHNITLSNGKRHGLTAEGETIALLFFNPFFVLGASAEFLYHPVKTTNHRHEGQQKEEKRRKTMKTALTLRTACD